MKIGLDIFGDPFRNRQWRRYILLIYALIFMVGCKKAASLTENQAYVKFAVASVTTDAGADSVSIGVRWSLTEWSVSADSGGFITGFSDTIGGRKDKQGIISHVYVRLEANLTDQPRSQEIMLRDHRSGILEKMQLTQPSLPEADIINLNPEISYQKITGFGGMINPSWTGSTQLTVQDIEKLYGPDGLGLNIGRLMLYPDASVWSRELAIAKRAQELGAILFATPWTPPPALKSVNTNSNANGEYLLPENFAAFAAHLKSYVDYNKNNGVNIYAVSVQNEPDWKVSYDGCSYTPQQLLDFVKNHGRSVGTRLIAGETVQFNKAYTDAILNDPVAVNNFDIAATHLYGYDFRTKPADYPLARQHLKELWMTEHLFNETANGPEWFWPPALRSSLAEEIHDCMEHNFNAYIYWYLKRYYSFMGENRNPNNPAGWYTADDGEITKPGYIISHYAKYATGRTRIGVTLGAGISAADYLVTAYAGANDITAVLINRSEEAKVIDFAVPIEIRSVTAAETTADENMSSPGYHIRGDRKSVRLRVSAESILSVKLKKN